MNRSQKIMLMSLLVLAHLTTTVSYAQEAATTAQQEIETTLKRIQKMPFSICDLPTSDFVVAGFFSLLGAAAGHLCVNAIAHLVDQETTKTINPTLFHPGKWGKSLWLGTVGGAATVGYLTLAASGPKFLAQQVNQPLLAAVIASKPTDLKNTLDGIYVSDRFARAVAFRDLNTLRTTLCSILESFTKLKGKPGYSEAKNLTPAVVSYIAAVKEAMLTIKSDPRWFEECNASTLAMTQAHIQGCQNAQLASTVIQLAHQ